MLISDHRLAILLHDGIRGVQGKTGLALLRYTQSVVAAVIDQDCAGAVLREVAGIDLDVPIVASVQDALAYDPDVLVIGIAPSGGILPEPWWQEVQVAARAGLSVANGLHTQMAIALAPLLPPDSRQRNQWIWDIRQEPPGLTVGRGEARNLACRRVLTVGTDMAIGKMVTSLELDRVSRQRGWRSRFVGTGQAGIMIAGSGIPLDAVRVDFAAGAVERAVLHAGLDTDVVYIEGQGSLLNPASTATLPLLRGAQPTHLILAHRHGQTHIRNAPHVPIPPLPAVIHLYETVAAAGGAFAPAKVVGIALNTAHLDAQEAEAAIAHTTALTGLPCTDPIRHGADPLVDAIFA